LTRFLLYDGVDKTDVLIIGAGITGLNAALHLQKAGIDTVILEKSAEPGGRVRSIIKNGYTLDYGFQVLHPNYPELRKSGIWDSLVFSSFRSGALISREKSLDWYSNPLIDPVGFMRTGFRIPFKLAEIPSAIRLFVDATTMNDDFMLEDAPLSCREYLSMTGISRETIQKFFVPFFGGVLLDPELNAGYRYFLWLFNKFLTGKPGLPKGGMQSLPFGLASMLRSEESLQLNTEVKGIEDGVVFCRDGRKYQPSYIINAANLEGSAVSYRSTRNFYFEGPLSKLVSPSLILNGNTGGNIMHFCFPSAVQKAYAPEGRALCSVTLRDPALDPEPAQILKELALLYPSMPWKEWRFLEAFHLPKAIPEFTGQSRPSFKRSGNVVFAGDHLSYPSINGAMRSGREAAESIIAEFRKF
jgi:hypothetical protein